MLFNMNAKEIVIGSISIASLGLGTFNTITNVRTTKKVKKLRSEMDQYVLKKPIQAKNVANAVDNAINGDVIEEK
ncbi:MAG: hypothetical protein IKA36_06060 [Clostridia bacterium]|nr:hypothetical protein [Clostridia bacterium]